MAKNELDNAGKYNNSMAPNKSNPTPYNSLMKLSTKLCGFSSRSVMA